MQFPRILPKGIARCISPIDVGCQATLRANDGGNVVGFRVTTQTSNILNEPDCVGRQEPRRAYQTMGCVVANRLILG